METEALRADTAHSQWWACGRRGSSNHADGAGHPEVCGRLHFWPLSLYSAPRCPQLPGRRPPPFPPSSFPPPCTPRRLGLSTPGRGQKHGPSCECDRSAPERGGTTHTGRPWTGLGRDLRVGNSPGRTWEPVRATWIEENARDLWF